MWNTESLWFDTAGVMTIFAVGNILLGHFEEHKAKWKRLMKLLVTLGLILTLSASGYRWIAFSLLAAFSLLPLYIHLVWLPKNGVSGWTGEPKEKYYELIGHQPK